MKAVVNTSPEAVSGLTAGSTYYVENAGEVAIYVTEGSEAPSSPLWEDGIELLPGNSWNRRITDRHRRRRGNVTLKVGTGNELYAWTFDGRGVLQLSELG